MPRKPAKKPRASVKEALPPALEADMRSVVGLVESWSGPMVDPREAYQWGTDATTITSSVFRDDFFEGRYRPFYEHEYDLQTMWAAGRWLAAADAAGAGLLRAMTDYAIGTGMSYEVEGMDGEPLGFVQDFLDSHQKDIGWTGLKEREIFEDGETYGDAFVWLHEKGWGKQGAMIVAPEWVTEPTNKGILGDGYDGMCWRFGVASQPNRAMDVTGYFVSFNGSPTDYETVSAQDMVHIKRNSKERAKRGLSSFYPAINLLKDAAKVFENALKGGAIQAAIAYIQECAPGVTQGQAQNMIANTATGTQNRTTSSGGYASQYTRRFPSGTVITTSSGMKYHHGPMGTPAGPLFVELVQAALRLAGASKGIPEYMISGDASNNNYASILVAGSPFVRAIEHMQTTYKAAFERMHWRMLEMATLRHKLANGGIYTLEDLKRAVKLTVTPTSVVLGNPKEQEEIRNIRNQAGVLSVKTWQKQVDLDPEEEAANIATEPKPEPPTLFGAPIGQPPPRPGFFNRPVQESVPWWQCGKERL